MATITLTIRDDHISRIIDAFDIHYEYNLNKLEGETRAQFAKRMLAKHAKDITLATERRIARAAAYATANAAIEEPDVT